MLPGGEYCLVRIRKGCHCCSTVRKTASLLGHFIGFKRCGGTQPCMASGCPNALASTKQFTNALM